MNTYKKLLFLATFSLTSGQFFAGAAQLFDALQTVVSQQDRINLGMEMVRRLPTLDQSFAALGLPQLVAEIDRVNSGAVSYELSELPKLLKNFSLGLTELIGKKDAFFIAMLRVIDTAQSLGIAKRLMDGSKAIGGFVSVLSDIILLQALMKDRPKIHVTPAPTPEPLPAIQGDLEV